MRAPALVLAVSLALAAATTSAAQEEEEDFGRRGWYVGGGFVYGFENFDLSELSGIAGVDISASGSPGIDIRGGYRFNRWVALEGNFDYYADFDIEANGSTVFNADAFSFFANAKGYPLDGRVQPYGLFGIGVLAAAIDYDFDYDYYDYDYYDYENVETDAVFAVRLGGGVDVYVTPKFLLNLDVGYVFATSDMNLGGPADIGTDLIPLALTGQFRF